MGIFSFENLWARAHRAFAHLKISVRGRAWECLCPVPITIPQNELGLPRERLGWPPAM